MNRKHARTFDAIFAEPTLANIRWADVEGLLIAMGAERQERAGSRVRFQLRGEQVVLHKPHPSSQLTKSGVRSVRIFLEAAGYESSDRH